MLRLGVLQCDSIDRPHVDVDGDYDVLYTKLLSRPDVEVVVSRADCGDLPRSLRSCDAWIIPGSRASVYDDAPWIKDLRRFVRRALDAGRPLVGICFGHQMVGLELGAEVAKAPTGWNIGAIDYRLHRPAPGESVDAVDRFRLIASHQDQVLELPEGAELLASAPTCPVAGMMIGDQVLTIQAHPEFRAGLAESLYRSRVERLGAASVDAALASLDQRLDQERVSDWIVEFARR